jgi:hypothetical protein
MEAGFRTPLLDMFRRGEVSREIKLLAARGGLAPRAHEQLMLLVELVADPDQEIRAVTEDTIAAIPPQALAAFLARADTSATLRGFFSARGIQPAAIPADDSEEPLIDRGETDDPQADPEASAPGAADKQGMLQRLTSMTVVARMKVAMKGTREERAILIRDPNKLVSVAVLSSPKVNESEIEGFAKMANVSEEVLRIIGNTRAWVKNYGVVSALARNPKTPVAVALNLVQRLSERDLKLISLDRNAQEPLKLAVRKRLMKGKHE